MSNSDFIMPKSGTVLVKFKSGSVALDHQIWLYHPEKKPIFVASNSNLGKTYDIGSFAECERLVFALRSHDGHTYYTKKSLNSDACDHVRKIQQGIDRWEFQWEDMFGLGERDFNDIVMEVVVAEKTAGKADELFKLGYLYKSNMPSDSQSITREKFFSKNACSAPIIGASISPGIDSNTSDSNVTVYFNGTRVIAEDAEGNVIASGVCGTDDSTVINAAISASFGRVVLSRNASPTEIILQNGWHRYVDYILSSTIIMKDGVDLECGGSVFDARSLDSAIFYINGGASWSLLMNAPARIHNCSILGAISNKKSIGIHVHRYMTGFGIDRVSIENVFTGISVEGESYNTHITNCYINGCSVGVWFSDGGHPYGPNASSVSHCDIGASNVCAIDLDAGVHIPLSENWLEAAPILIDADHSVYVHNNYLQPGSGNIAIDAAYGFSVVGNYFLLDSSAYGLKFTGSYKLGQFNNNAVYFVSGSYIFYAANAIQISMQDNIFDGSSGTVIFGPNIIQPSFICRNIGYITENSGSSKGTGASQTIAHGLVTTPKKISIVPTVSGANVTGLYANSTNIYVTVTSGKTFNWSAEVF